MTSAEFSRWIAFYTLEHELRAGRVQKSDGLRHPPKPRAGEMTANEMIAALKSAAPSNVGKVPH